MRLQAASYISLKCRKFLQITWSGRLAESDSSLQNNELFALNFIGIRFAGKAGDELQLAVNCEAHALLIVMDLNRPQVVIRERPPCGNPKRYRRVHKRLTTALMGWVGRFTSGKVGIVGRVDVGMWAHYKNHNC